jgi:hypothetical protein
MHVGSPEQALLPFASAGPSLRKSPGLTLEEELSDFAEFGTVTQRAATSSEVEGQRIETPVFINEFWTAKQRAACSLHEISYRACFKPQLPRFFVERLTAPGDMVYDPFMGRGTTLLESALLGRKPAGCDINPLSRYLVRPRLAPPDLTRIAERLAKINFQRAASAPDDLLVFYHPKTLAQIAALRTYFSEREEAGKLDATDEWIRMVALNRLTGHSNGFFSVYTLPPNQATSVKAQQKINRDRDQTPPERDVAAIILKKSRSLLSEVDGQTRAVLARTGGDALLITGAAWETPSLPTGSVALVVTSPPFLDIVDYAGDNWLRCWFVGIDPSQVKLTVPGNLEKWSTAMTNVFRELERVLRPGGHVAFEVGEVRKGTIKLEEAVLQCGLAAGLDPRLVMVNAQEFTKTANCWGVDNNSKGTNTNRIVLFQKGEGKSSGRA